MRYNFDVPVDRSNNLAAKFDERKNKFGREDVIPLWIADMDFMVAQPIMDAIQQRASQGIFGYTSRPVSYFESVCDWQKRRNHWEIDRDLIGFNLGVVPALCTAVREFSEEKDKILFLTPVYSEFFDTVEKWGRIALTSALKEENQHYTVDFQDFEEKLKQGPKMFILCSPHNPVGRVWSREELVKMGELCLKYNVMVISDEIHSDLMLWGKKHIPFASISEAFARNTITCISATKTFNLAGLQASTTIFPNAEVKAKFEGFWQRLDITRNNCFSVVAVEAAYRYGEDWLEQLLRYVEQNILYVKEFCDENIPQIKTYFPESTYLMWLDCRALNLGGDALVNFMVNEANLGLGDGRAFGTDAGFMRMNVACPKATLEKAMNHLKQAVDRLVK
ncbi:MalY/PatB family protein [Geosporobacter ferrireducens]|uniref:cysteine-S-conjugate beta-lyase n=1 Tax=Geosporobacter ferrireducens TaxID=1424294 RepID=A0A1D8GJ51_9FIRM|nr:MalY/PatB family protein [Geosporobacter ferrireducens]AOT70945.1 cystathionine beta-lyase [Geosporobacter ferrireducens]MTI53658.1 pyridoxal phosphate-dependent aminotransferase [Geosporobacter ferrireducens]